MTIRVDGLDRLAATLQDAGAAMEDMPRAQAETADIVARAARREAPQLTGRLARSIRPDTGNRVGGATTNVPYGWPVHSGVPRHNIRPNPFMVRAMERTQPQWERAYLTELERIIGEVKGD